MLVYFNLHKKSWSIRDPKTGLVINKAQPQYLVILQNVTFKVSEAGRQRVIREKRKNVHAFASGEIAEGLWSPLLKQATVPVTYNPYKGNQFIRTDTGEPLLSCSLLVMSTKLVEIFEGDKPTGRLKRIPVVKAKL